MPYPRLSATRGVAPEPLAAGIAALITEFELPPQFPAEVEHEASAASATGHGRDELLIGGGADREDHTNLPLVTLDPKGSRDLDQAFAILRADGGHTTLHYAIADVAAHVRPGGAIDTESRARGETVYLPGRRLPLHPPALSEGVASLLPNEDRLAVLWTLTLDAAGELVGAPLVRRAVVRSTAQLDYAGAQAQLTAGTPHPQIAALAQLGPVLLDAAARRGAIDLPESEQDLLGSEAEGFTLTWVPREPVEDWNAQLSLATGRAAASLMLAGKRGLLRTLPPAPAPAEQQLRAAADALGVAWGAEQSLAHLLHTVDPELPATLAFLDHCRTLLRGAGYLVLAGVVPADPGAVVHSAVAAPYAHVTAPLRRLGDRFATETALAAAHGVPVPAWAQEALPLLPEALTAAGRRSGQVARAVLDLGEALVLAGRVGERFAASVVEVDQRGAEIRLQDPPVLARAKGSALRAGTMATVELTAVDPVRRTVSFVASPPAA